MRKDADERLDREIRIEIRTEQGIDSRMALAKSLEELADESELTKMSEVISDMLTRQQEQKQEQKTEWKERKKKIDAVVLQTEIKYGRIVTPSTSKHKKAETN